MPLGATLTHPSTPLILSASVPADVFQWGLEYDLYCISLLRTCCSAAEPAWRQTGNHAPNSIDAKTLVAMLNDNRIFINDI